MKMIAVVLAALVCASSVFSVRQEFRMMSKKFGGSQLKPFLANVTIIDSNDDLKISEIPVHDLCVLQIGDYVHEGDVIRHVLRDVALSDEGRLPKVIDFSDSIPDHRLGANVYNIDGTLSFCTSCKTYVTVRLVDGVPYPRCGVILKEPILAAECARIKAEEDVHIAALSRRK